ncbi:MAG: hypothetical protein RR458_03995, partial [Clostridia bacterium]
MATIKGINVEIGGETLGLTKALKKVNEESNATASELKQIEKALKLNPDNVVLLKQKQDVLNESFDASTKKLKELKDAQKKLGEDKDANVDVAEYRRFQREIEKATQEVKKFAEEKKSLSKIGEEIEKVNRAAKETSGELKQVDEALKLNPNSVVLLKQKQDLLNASFNESTEKLKALKSTQKDVENQFKNGEIDEGQYRAFQREIEKASAEVKKFGKEKDSFSKIGEEIEKVKKHFSKLTDSVERTTDKIKES